MSGAAPLILTDRPSPFPLDFAPGGKRLLLVDLSETDFRRASFLDERLLAAGATATSVETEAAAALAQPLTGTSDFIFHIGHCGSSLVSRLFGEGDRFFSLREPAVLRTLARQPMVASPAFESRLRLVLNLLARVWRPGQRSLVKATSFVSEIAPAVLAASPNARALAMFVSPQAAIATRLGGPASRAELPSVAPGWLGRLHRRLGISPWRLETLSEGEIAALGWTCEMLALADIAEAFPHRVRWLDFDRLLMNLAEGLRAAADFLRGPGSPEEIAGMLRGGDLGRYAKAPEFPYDTATRTTVIAAARREHAREIARGLDWINAAGNTYPRVARAATAAALATRDC